jgi:hypothetical protein
LSNESSTRVTHQQGHKQQTPSMQGWKGYALYYAKPVLRVSPYFHVLALFKSFQKSYFRDPAIFRSFPRKVHPILLIQECKQLNLSIMIANTLTKLSSLTYYVMTVTNKRYSYPRVTTIRIDIHHIRENPTNMFSTLGPRMALDHMYLTWSTYSNLSWVTDRFGWIPLLLRKMTPYTIHNTPADRSVGPYLISLPSKPMKQ